MSNRKAALRIVRQLRANGHQALFAGGCVRDMLLGRRANDYDVATDAKPKQIMHLFRRTLKIGAQFGVVMVLMDDKQIEVATFRTESGYADGRHPDHVQFATAREDALRRDFTINGMFYDPIKRTVLDFVGGQDDLQKKRLKTIGQAHERFSEDYLRMLRAIRFAIRFDFEIEKTTWQAICDWSHKITHISAERIAAELEGIFTHPNRQRGAELLRESGLAKHIFAGLSDSAMAAGAKVLGQMPSRIDWPLALAGFLADCDTSKAAEYAEQLKSSRAMIKHIGFLLKRRGELLDGQMPLAHLKLLAAEPYFGDLFDLQKAIQKAGRLCMAGLTRLKKRAMEVQKKGANPKPLLDGHELIALGAVPGPMVGTLSRELYIAQLAEHIHTAAEARAWAENWLKKHASGG